MLYSDSKFSNVNENTSTNNVLNVTPEINHGSKAIDIYVNITINKREIIIIEDIRCEVRESKY